MEKGFWISSLKSEKWTSVYLLHAFCSTDSLLLLFKVLFHFITLTGQSIAEFLKV